LESVAPSAKRRRKREPAKGGEEIVEVAHRA